MASSLLRFLLVQTQTHSATAAVESMDRWSTARPPAPARPATLGSHSLRRGRGKGSMALSLVQASFLTPSASNHLTWQDTRPAGLALDICTLLHHSVALLSSLGCLSYNEANPIGLLLMLLPSLPRALLQLPTGERTTKYIA